MKLWLFWRLCHWCSGCLSCEISIGEIEYLFVDALYTLEHLTLCFLSVFLDVEHLTLCFMSFFLVVVVVGRQ